LAALSSQRSIQKRRQRHRLAHGLARQRLRRAGVSRYQPAATVRAYRNRVRSTDHHRIAQQSAGRGGFNPNLNPQTSLSNELGFRGSTARFQYDTAVFFIKTWDEITPFELPSSPGRAFFRNAGQSRRIGVETRLATPEWKGLRGEVSYTYSDFEFEKYTVNTADLKGNIFPGIPRHRWEGLLRYSHPLGFFGQLHVHRVGQFYVNDLNTAANPAYTLGQLLAGWELRRSNFESSIFFGVNNLFDADYNANTRINAALGRYYEPGPPLNLFGGMRVRIVVF
jgi:iron complex outermembrane receptor protein